MTVTATEERTPTMSAKLPDGRELLWFAEPLHLGGDPGLVEQVKKGLAVEEQVGVTPTGPRVPSTRSNQLAVYAVAQRVMDYDATWTGAPDLLEGIPEGAADGASVPNGEKPKPAPAQGAQLRAANEVRMVLGLEPLTAARFHISPRRWLDNKNWKWQRRAPEGAPNGGQWVDMGRTGIHLGSPARGTPKPNPQPKPNPMPNPTPKPRVGGRAGWRKQLDAALGRVPRGKDFGRTEMDDEIADLQAQYDDAAAKVKYWEDLLAKDEDAFYDAAEKALGHSAERLTRSGIIQLLAGDTLDNLEWRLQHAKKEAAKGGTQVDVRNNKLGPKAEEHIDALREVMDLMDEELERRIQEAAVVKPSPEELAAIIQHAEDLSNQADAARAEASRLEKLAGETGQQADLEAADDAREQFMKLQSDATRARINAYTLENPVAAVPGSQRYKQIQRDEALKMLAEIRAMGGIQNFDIRSSIYGKTPEEVNEILQRAGMMFPKDWHDAVLARLGPNRTKIIQSPDDRGYNNDFLGIIALSEEGIKIDQVKDELEEVAAHELAHSMEHAVEGLKVIQYLMSLLRSPRDQEFPIELGKATSVLDKEFAYKDKWRIPYSGKIYNGGSAEDNWEMLTVGIQALFYGARGFDRPPEMGGFDAEYRALILALLAAL